MPTFRMVLAALGRLEEWLLVAAFSVMGVVLLAQVFFRYVLNAPLIWSEELARYLMVWITFLGINYGIRRGVHIEMGYFFAMLPRPLQRAVPVVTQAFLVVCLVLFLPGAFRFVAAQSRIDSSAMQVNMGLVYLAIPLGMVISAASLATNTIQRFFSVARPEGDR
jgi:TRAP-type C4-dicarboxylate transport system permease small subunit